MNTHVGIRRQGLIQRLLGAARAGDERVNPQAGTSIGDLSAFLGQDDMLPRMLYPGARVDGRYWVEEEIGVGGLCLIHRLRDGDTGQMLALKSLQPDFMAMPFYSDMMRREAELQKRLSHRNILGVEGILTSGDGRNAILLPLLEGGTLEERVERRGPLDENEGRLFLALMLDVLDTLQRMSMVHLDIAPDNIMFRSEVISSVQLIDFGLARQGPLVGDEPGDDRLFGGKWSWASPEAITGSAITPASDLYSLALVTIYALTGQKQDMGVDFETAAKAREMMTGLDDLPRGFRDLLETMLQPNPFDRAPVFSKAKSL